MYALDSLVSFLFSLLYLCDAMFCILLLTSNVSGCLRASFFFFFFFFSLRLHTRLLLLSIDRWIDAFIHRQRDFLYCRWENDRHAYILFFFILFFYWRWWWCEEYFYEFSLTIRRTKCRWNGAMFRLLKIHLSIRLYVNLIHKVG